MHAPGWTGEKKENWHLACFCSRTFTKTWSSASTWTPGWLWWGPTERANPRYSSCLWGRSVLWRPAFFCSRVKIRSPDWRFLCFVAAPDWWHDPQTFSRQDRQISPGKTRFSPWNLALLCKHELGTTALFLQHLTEQLELDLSPLEYMMKCYPEIKEKEEMRKIIGRYGLTGKQQVR